VKRVQSSEISLRSLPNRKTSNLLNPLVIERAANVARMMNLPESGPPVDQRAIGQILYSNDKVGSSSNGGGGGGGGGGVLPF